LRQGCNLLQSLEEILNGLLGKLRESAGQEAMRALPWSNAPRIMATSGSTGSPLNISQMIACVGQQAVGGKSIENGFVNRTLPHFEYHSLTPSAKGFVANSFYTGLTAIRFFISYHGRSRRPCRYRSKYTAETGYMARRLMKASLCLRFMTLCDFILGIQANPFTLQTLQALEDLSLRYDSTVRTI
jgi:DNA-directed RNA polymerase III subunit RPC1